tara:strand:+ start:362 stop:901 length:540 start_codon:yes stop_codon:yes gene_type:complete
MPQITISGHPGSGTSTLVSGICGEMGWDSLNGGQIFRDEAKKRDMSLSEFGILCANDFTVDKSLDEILKEKMRDPNGPEVMESRLSGWWAHLLNLECIRIWLDVSENVRAQRVVNREGVSLEDAVAANQKRSEVDLDRYQQMYGLNPEDPTPYTHIIDASEKTADEVLEYTMQLLRGTE